MALAAEQKSLVKATVPILEARGAEITSVFYGNLLRENPGLRNIFNAANQAQMTQPKALAHAVLGYAKQIDDPSVLMPTIELICNKHASLLVQPEHYPIVGKYLIGAFGEVLGDALTPELVDAWTAAYGELADVFISMEQGLFRQADDWTEWRKFKAARKVEESGEITSFWLAPVDGNSLPSFKPGQYVSVQVDVPALGHAQTRQYSLSEAPLPDHYRISVKKEPGGLVSNLLHGKEEGDVILVSRPMGNFFLDGLQASEGQDQPLVLISGGVGLTSLISILNTLVARKSTRPISWIHAARTSDVRAFGPEVRELSRKQKNVRAVFFNSRVAAGDVRGEGYDHAGKLDLGVLDRKKELFSDEPKAEYFVCGPTGFMLDTERALRAYGVDAERIHMELYGVGGVQRADSE